MDERLEFAARSEKQAARILSAAMGQPVNVNPSGRGYDLFAEQGTTIEVKAARPSEFARGRLGWQFLLKRKGRRGVVADLLFLLCYTYSGDVPIGGFVIPRQAVIDRCKLTIPGFHPASYQGKYARYYVALDEEVSHL